MFFFLIANYIDKEFFLSLTEEDIKELVPLGLRRKFSPLYQELLLENSIVLRDKATNEIIEKSTDQNSTLDISDEFGLDSLAGDDKLFNVVLPEVLPSKDNTAEPELTPTNSFNVESPDNSFIDTPNENTALSKEVSTG